MRYHHYIRAFATTLVLLMWWSLMWSQSTLEFQGQLSLLSSYSPDNELEGYFGGRYIPELSFAIPLDSSQTKLLDFEASGNMYANTLFSFFDDSESDGSVQPYRIWARYTSSQFELRAGLQKIDFGSATLLRPLQWFNQIDPRDPLQLTNGVYGVLGRYYFLNNANIWLWALIGNDKTRGFDAIETNNKIPEFGGRYQHPTPNGEIALSYHHRNANSTHLSFVPQFEKIPEHRFGLDGKWDLTVGVWFEAAVIHKTEDLGILTNQTHLNFGMDYTFGLGNGLHVVLEHLTSATDDSFFGFEEKVNLTGTAISYPLGFFDNISTVVLYNWTAKDIILNAIYSRDFGSISGYFMAYYNPSTVVGFQQNELVNQFEGPGVRIMLVYNH